MRICCNRWIQGLILAVLLSSTAHADSYRWFVQTGSPYGLAGQRYSSTSQVCSAVISALNTATITYSLLNCEATPISGAPTAAGQGNSVRTNHQWCYVAEPSNCTSGGTSEWVPLSSESFNDCATISPAGTTRVLSAASADNWVPGEEACDANQCGWTLSSLYTTFIVTANGSNADELWKTTATGQQCTPSQSATTSVDSDASTAEEECFTLEGIGEICVENDASAAPTVNDVSTEHTADQADNCYPTADGGTMCVQSSTADTPTAPPVPNDGTSTTTPATPSVTTINNDNSVTNYYSSTTVNNQASSSSSSSSSSGTNTGTDGDGGSAGGSGTGTGCQGTGCTSSGSGGDWYTKKTDTFGTVLNGFITSVQGSAVFTQIGGFFAVNVGGSCPVWSVSVPVYGSIVFDQQCSSAMQGIWPYIAAIVIASAAWLAFRIAFL